VVEQSAFIIIIINNSIVRNWGFAQVLMREERFVIDTGDAAARAAEAGAMHPDVNTILCLVQQDLTAVLLWTLKHIQQRNVHALKLSTPTMFRH
jgi:hypothetical protein